MRCRTEGNMNLAPLRYESDQYGMAYLTRNKPGTLHTTGHRGVLVWIIFAIFGDVIFLVESRKNGGGTAQCWWEVLGRYGFHPVSTVAT